MTHILLTGAGFSRNWGCWLADEVFEYLLADPQLSIVARTQLWRDNNTGGNYENAIAALRANPPEHRLFLSLLAGMFNEMRNAYTGMGFSFEWTVDRRFQIHSFLQRFDAIFTLNQDTLLEHHYLTQFLPTRPDNRLRDWDMPGVANTASASGGFSATAPKTLDATTFVLKGGAQPYIKLHGSHDWTTNAGYVLITGGNKETDISDNPLLAAYLSHFKTAVCNEHARVMIIGYGFGDRHINSILLEAAQRGAKFFIVDTGGINVLDKRGSDDQIAYRLWDQMAFSIIGASRRQLSSTFSSDRIEHGKLHSFFAS